MKTTESRMAGQQRGNHMTVLPIYNMLTLPNSNVFFRKDLYEEMTGKQPVQDEKMILIIAKEEVAVQDLSLENVYPIGVFGYIKEVNEQGFLLIHVTHRVRIDEIDVRRRYGINILGIRNGSMDMSPSHDTVLRKEETMLVLGRDDQLQSLFRLHR